MKFFFMLLFVLFGMLSCKKEFIRYPYCWHCEIKETQRIVDTCTEKELVPSFFNENGTAVGADCELKQ